MKKKDKTITLSEFADSNNCIAINCNTKAKAKSLCDIFNKNDIKPASGESYSPEIINKAWTELGPDLCFSNRGGFASIYFYTKYNFKIINFEDLETTVDLSSNFMDWLK